MTDPLINQAQAEFDKILDHLKSEYSRLQIGRASAALVEGLVVEAYGSMQPLKNIASVSVPDAKTVQIQPWDKGILGAVEKAIQQSGLGLTPANDGLCVRLNIPPLTEERRKEITKVVHRMAEEARISVRNARQKVHDSVRDLQKNSRITEDQMHGAEKKLQEKVDAVNAKIEEHAKGKEKDVMTV